MRSPSSEAPLQLSVPRRQSGWPRSRRRLASIHSPLRPRGWRRARWLPASGAPTIWDDEGTVVGARCGLSNEAAQLVGDITLALNLNEQGSEEQREKFGTRNDLPHCLSTSPDRGEILGTTSCLRECPFDLCPYYRPATETA